MYPNPAQLEKLTIQAQASLAALKANSYPGRVLVAGRSSGGRLFLAYAIMGRSSNSRNRMFVAEDQHVRTEAVDPAKLEDPSLIIYYPLRTEGTIQILTNGDQTDTIWKEYKHRHLLAGETPRDGGVVDIDSLVRQSFADALETRSYEPDPHQTSRISCMANAASPKGSYSLSILKAQGQLEGLEQGNYFHYRQGVAGFGHCIHTYAADGNPIPQFQGEPVPVPVQDNADEAVEFWWNLLNPDNRISLLVRLVSTDGQIEQRIFNRFA